jgi:hypothetical protein
MTAVHDSQKLDDVLDVSNIGKEVSADSAYRLVQVRGAPEGEGLAGPYPPARRTQQPSALRAPEVGEHDALEVRAPVEHVFGHQQGAMGGKVGRTIGIARAAVAGSASNPWKMPAWELAVPCMRSSTPGSGSASNIFLFAQSRSA